MRKTESERIMNWNKVISGEKAEPVIEWRVLWNVLILS